VAMRGGRGPAMWVFSLSVGACACFFVPPSLTCAVADMASLVTVSVMVGAALVISTPTLRLRQHAAAARPRARQTAALSAMSRALARRRSVDELLQAAARHISAVFESRVALLVPQASGRLALWPRGTGEERRAVGEPALFVPGAREEGIAQWVYEHQHRLGLPDQVGFLYASVVVHARANRGPSTPRRAPDHRLPARTRRAA
jgi:two-component system, OmpR family, sensor histidine kinase KdpD